MSIRDTLIRTYAPALVRATGCTRDDAVLTLVALSPEERAAVAKAFRAATLRKGQATEARRRRLRTR